MQPEITRYPRRNTPQGRAGRRTHDALAAGSALSDADGPIRRRAPSTASYSAPLPVACRTLSNAFTKYIQMPPLMRRGLHGRPNAISHTRQRAAIRRTSHTRPNGDREVATGHQWPHASNPGTCIQRSQNRRIAPYPQRLPYLFAKPLILLLEVVIFRVPAQLIKLSNARAHFVYYGRHSDGFALGRLRKPEAQHWRSAQSVATAHPRMPLGRAVPAAARH